MPAKIRLARRDEIPPGAGRTFEVLGRSVALFHDGDTFHALEATCPHMGGDLGEGVLTGGIVACPWHGWQFAVCTGVSPHSDAVRVATFPVTVEGEDVFVEVDGGAG